MSIGNNLFTPLTTNPDNCPMIAETDRLYLRPLAPDDSAHLCELNADPEVLRYTPDVPFSSLQAAREFIAQQTQHARPSMGRCAVIRRRDNAFLGWCGLQYHPEERLTELGYRFHRRHWGNGYATEAAQASLEHGFSTLLLPEIYAHVLPENTASQKVLHKCGMRFLKQSLHQGRLIDWYFQKNPYLAFRSLTAIETYPVRHPVLRAGKPLESCAFEGDDNPATWHYGAFFKSELIGVITLLEKKSPLFPKNRQLQLRGMAVLPAFQKKGIGEQLVKSAEAEAQRRKAHCIWMNAREIALSFYRKMDYLPVGDPFTIPGVGIHFVMLKSFHPTI